MKKQNKSIYKLDMKYGRMGTLYGTFAASDEEIEKLYGHELYLGEILGKHSEVTLTLEPNGLIKLSDDADVVAMAIKYDLLGGINPLDYLDSE